MAENGHNLKGELEKQLDTLPFHKPSSNFADMVMAKVEGIEASQGCYKRNQPSLLKRCIAYAGGLFQKNLRPLSALAVVLLVAGVVLHTTNTPPQYSYAYTDTNTSLNISTTVIADGDTSIDIQGGYGVLSLSGDSVVQIQGDGVFLESGRVFFDLDLKGREFRVFTRQGEVLVTGTEFFVEVESSGVVVTVTEGVVTFIKDAVEKKVHEGNQLATSGGNVLVTKYVPDVKDSSKPVAGKPDRVKSGTEKPDIEVKAFDGYADTNHGSSGFKRDSVQSDGNGDGVSVKVGSSDNLEKLFDE